MPKTRKSHPPSLKAKVAVEAIKAAAATGKIGDKGFNPLGQCRRLPHQRAHPVPTRQRGPHRGLAQKPARTGDQNGYRAQGIGSIMVQVVVIACAPVASPAA